VNSPGTPPNLAVDPRLFASTYSTQQLITTLYLENLHLKNLHLKGEHPQAFEEADVELPMVEQAISDGKYATARDYVALKAYQSMGAKIDVIAFGRRRTKRIYEYDGVRVLSGYGYELLGLLALRDYVSVSVHFLNPNMWNLLYPARHRSRFVFFLHGYEVDRWIRREFEHGTPEELRLAIARSLYLQSFWKHVTENLELRAHFVFVSEWWRRLVAEDMEVVIPARRSSIIHNFIDTELFSYREKPPEQAYKILWVRSASSRKYGADLAARCLETLRQRSDVWHRLSVRIIGDGHHFDEFESRFSNDPRVSIERRFASQQEIAALHKEYGLLIVPTRYDSQGVSRDEAMSSGLVPVTNAVAAVPEFVDTDCAILAGPEDVEGLVQGILRVTSDPELFQAMSHRAAQRARQQCGPEATVRREAALLGMVEREQVLW
jgi:glycosyltransferase involved in cell wall biosynthesis